MPLTYYRGCWHVISRGLFLEYRQDSSSRKEFYDSKAFITHAALLRQGFPHCAKFLTAASRRSLDRVSVPVWLIILSDQLTIVTLVGHYPTNKLMVRGSLLKRQLSKKRSPFISKTTVSETVSGISNAFAKLSQIQGQVTHALLTRAPLYSLPQARDFSFDLHVLGTPPAFVLSQDQTLHLNSKKGRALYC